MFHHPPTTFQLLCLLALVLSVAAKATGWPFFGNDAGRSFFTNANSLGSQTPNLQLLASVPLARGRGGPACGPSSDGQGNWLVAGWMLSGISQVNDQLTTVWSAQSESSGGIGADDTPTLLSDGHTALTVDCWRGINGPSGYCAVRSFDKLTGTENPTQLSYPNNQTVIGCYVVQNPSVSDEIFYLTGNWDPVSSYVALRCASVSTMTEKWAVSLGPGSLKSSFTGNLAETVSVGKDGIVYAAPPVAGGGVLALDSKHKGKVTGTWADPFYGQGILGDVPVVGPLTGNVYVAVGSSFFDRQSCYVYALAAGSLKELWKADTQNSCTGSLSVIVSDDGESERVLVRGFNYSFFGLLSGADGTVVWQGPAGVDWTTSQQPFSSADVMPVATPQWIFAYASGSQSGIYALDANTGEVVSSWSLPYEGQPTGSLALGQGRQLGFVGFTGNFTVLSF